MAYIPRHWLASRDPKWILVTWLYVQGLATLPEPSLLAAMNMETQEEVRGALVGRPDHTSRLHRNGALRPALHLK